MAGFMFGFGFYFISLPIYYSLMRPGHIFSLLLLLLCIEELLLIFIVINHLPTDCLEGLALCSIVVASYPIL